MRGLTPDPCFVVSGLDDWSRHHLKFKRLLQSREVMSRSQSTPGSQVETSKPYLVSAGSRILIKLKDRLEIPEFQ